MMLSSNSSENEKIELNIDCQVAEKSTIMTGILVACVAFVFDIDFLANVISCGTLQVSILLIKLCTTLFTSHLSTFNCAGVHRL